MLVFFVAFGMPLPVLPRYVKEQLLAGDVAVGLTFGAYAVAAVVVRPFVGRLGDTRGRVGLVVGGATIVSLASLAHVGADSVPALVVARLVVGIGQASFVVGLVTLGLDMADEERRAAVSNYLLMGLQVGFGVGPVVGEVVLLRFGFTAVWVTSALVAAVAALLGLALRDVPIQLAARASRPALIHPSALWPGLVAGVAGIGYSGFLAFVPLHVEDIGLSSSAIVLLLSSFMVAAGRLLGAAVTRIATPPAVARTAIIAFSASLVLMGVWTTSQGLYSSTVTMSLAWAFVMPAMLTLAAEGTEEGERTSIVATTTLFLDVGIALGPTFLAILSISDDGHTDIFVLAGGLALLALLALRRAQSVARVRRARATVHGGDAAHHD